MEKLLNMNLNVHLDKAEREVSAVSEVFVLIRQERVSYFYKKRTA